MYNSRRYSIGHLVGVRDLGTVEITELYSDKIKVKQKFEYEVPWDSIYPLPIDVDTLKNIGFLLFKKTEFPHHLEYLTDIKINGRFYSCRGVLLKDRSLWYFNNISTRYVHEIQSLIWIIEPTFNFNLEIVSI